jgi:hypothetical protein
MSTSPLQFFKETALPTVVNPHSIYFIAPPSDPNHVEVYVTNADGSIARRVINSDDVQTMISTAISAANTLTIVADIAARNALTPTGPIFVFVSDATGDSTVASGGATYLWNPGTTAWIKVSEAESLDVVTQWANIQNKPTSSVSAIDTAVANSHTHSNKTQLDKVGENGSGMMTYNGSLVSGWNTTSW